MFYCREAIFCQLSCDRWHGLGPMTDSSHHDRSVTLLQEFGLKEYEAKAFVALTRLPEGTAKQVSEISEVPRTRVYDAVRTLESEGLVEIQHSSPQQFRAVSVAEATNTLQRAYEERTESLREALDSLSRTDDTGSDTTHEVWSLSGAAGITSRTRELVDDAERELVLVLGDPSLFTEGLVEGLQTAAGRGVTVLVGTTADAVRARVQDQLPTAEVFVSELDWLSGINPDDDTEIGRLLLVDRSAILVSTFHPQATDRYEQAVFGRGFDNGLVTVARRLMATGLPPMEDPGSSG
jgi:sugar-specific transcriptional regulator TrmB